jgi:hypothetical protein
VVARGHIAPGNRLGANRLGERAAAAQPGSGVSIVGLGISPFSTPEHPLALFRDDLQWLDAATLDKAVEMKVKRLRGAP